MANCVDDRDDAVVDPVSNAELVLRAMPLHELLVEYKDNPVFQQKLKTLGADFSHFRPCKRDGNCLYRAVGYALYERLLMDATSEFRQMLYDALAKRIAASFEDLDKAGFERIVCEDFVYTAQALLLLISRGFALAHGNAIRAPEAAAIINDLNARIEWHGDLLIRMQDTSYAMSLVVLLRLITSAYVRANAELFAPFVAADTPSFSAAAAAATAAVGGGAVPASVMAAEAAAECARVCVTDFCQRNIEPIGADADEVQIRALARALRINVVVMYLDASSHSSLTKHVFEEAPSDEVQAGLWSEPIYLLYRPGHYDLLYSTEPPL